MIFEALLPKMKSMKKALVYFQSGGPTPVINSSLYGVIREYHRHPTIFSRLYGAHYGVEGLIEGDLFDLEQEDLKEIEFLKQTPGQILGSSRKKLPSFDDPAFAKIIDTIKRFNIGYILTNGGNDSMDTCYRLSRFFAEKKMDVKILGIPKTVDNDLMITDHCVGFPSAARHIMDGAMMAKVDAASYQKGKIVIMEIMGRNAGWLTASTALLPEEYRPDYIYVPEMKWDWEDFLSQIKAIYEKKKYVFVALSEGAPLEKQNLQGEDSFGHASNEGVAYTAADVIKERLGISSRVILESTLQRSDVCKVIKIDSSEAIAVGTFAVRSLVEGETGKMVALKRVSSHPYRAECVLVGLESVANYEKKIPSSWIIDNQHMSQEFEDYLRPLILDLLPVKLENGVVRCAHLKLIPAKPENHKGETR